MNNSRFIIPVFIPNLGCPHKCTFCNQTAITSKNCKEIARNHLRAHIEKFISYNKFSKKSQIAFYGGTFLGIDEKLIKYLLTEASNFIIQGKVDTIRFSTRPETICKKTMDIIRDFPVSTIELGMQSMNNEVLLSSNRGHTADDTKNAVYMLKEHGYEVGLQMMVGLPKDNDSRSMSTAYKAVLLKPDFMRIYPTLILKQSLLAKWYKNGKYTPLTLEHAVSLVKKIYLFLKKNDIPVIRIGLQASIDMEKESLIAGPYHPAFGQLVFSEIFFDKAVSLIKKRESSFDEVMLLVNHRDISKMRGNKNINIKKIKNLFSLKSVNISPDKALSQDKIKIAFPL